MSESSRTYIDILIWQHFGVNVLAGAAGTGAGASVVVASEVGASTAGSVVAGVVSAGFVSAGAAVSVGFGCFFLKAALSLALRLSRAPSADES